MTALPCGCCEPTAQLTPLAIANRAALTAIAYRVGTFATFRTSMLEQIAHAAELNRLTTRADDDYAVTVIDLCAAVADVLAFYQERYANEAFIRTASQRQSIGRLARLIDYGLRPGVGAVAWLAFTVEDGKTLRVPKRLRVQSVPGQDEQPQTFEALEEVAADARLNRIRVLPPPAAANPLARGVVEALVAPGEAALAAAWQLHPNDRVIVWSTGAAGTVEELVVREVRTEEERVVVAWASPVRGSWTPAAPVAKVARSFRLFGRTAAETTMTAIEDTTVPGGIRWSLGGTSFALSATSSLALEARVDGIAVGTRLLVDDAAGATTLVTVTGVTSEPRTLGGLTDTVTVVSVTPAVPSSGDRRKVTVYELVEPTVPFWGYAYPGRLTGGSVFVPGRWVPDARIEIGRTIVGSELRPGVTLGVDEVSPGRTVLVGDAATEPVPATVAEVAIVGATVVFEPTATDTTTVRELGLDAASAGPIAGLQSQPLPSSFQLSSQTRELRVRIGEKPVRTVRLVGTVTTLVGAANALRAGLAAAGPEPELTGARVLSLNGRLLILPGGGGGRLEFLATEGDGTTVRELGLDGDQALPLRGLLTAPVSFPAALTSPAPEVAVTIGPVGPRAVAVSGATNLKVLAIALQAAIRGADPAPGFREAWVLIVEDRLLVLPGPLGSEIGEYLRLDLALDEPLDLAMESAFVLGNVAPASHGETVLGEVAGNGDASARFQRFSLKRKPLTYVPSEQAGGVESSLSVTVDGVAWREAPGLYGQDATAQVYAVRTADDGTTTIQFGDGRTGAPVPTGRGNVEATYRVGAGVAGRVRTGTLTSALDRPPGLKEVTNPQAARGGADPEAIEQARENAPATVRTFGRAVSLRDFGDLVRASGEVAKGQATWIWDGLERAIHLTVAGQRGGLFADEDLRRLGASLARARDPNYRLRLANFTPLPILLRGTVLVDERFATGDVLAEVRAAVLAALDFDAVDLGEALHLSDLYRVIHDVDGVVAADLDELQPKRPTDRNRPNVVLLPDATPAPLQPHVVVFAARPSATSPGTVLPAELATVEDPARDVLLAAAGGRDA